MRRGFAAALVVLATGAGCSDLVGAHFDDPTLAASSPATCSIAKPGQASVRVGDFVPSTDRHDLCLARTDGSSPVDGVALVASAGGGPTGLGYEQVLAPVALPAGAYDVQLQPAGQGCSGPPLATASFCVDGDQTVTLLLLGDGTTQPSIAAFPESASAPGSAEVRFVHAIAGAGNLDFGTSDQSSLPASVTPLVANVPFASTGAAGTASAAIDANGYVSVPAVATAATLATAPVGSSADALTTQVLAKAHRYTAVAAGSTTDPRFPRELFVCDDTQTDGARTACGGVPYAFTLDTVSPALLGVFAIHEAARRSALMSAIARLDSEAVCAGGVMSDDDKKALTVAALASGHFVYSTWFRDTLATPVDDPTDQQGNVPPAPTAPACADASAQADLAAVFDCLSANCSTQPGDPSGRVIDDGEQCIAQYCVTPIEKLVLDATPCWACAFAQMQGYTSFQDATTACTTDPGASLAWNGQSGVVLLSRFPIKKSWQWVLPATLMRASMVGTTIVLPNETQVDLVCIQQPVIGDGVVLPYTGAYGNGKGAGADAWAQELLLDTGKMVSKVESLLAAPGRRTIVAGDWNTGPGVPGVIEGNFPDAFGVLSASLPQGVPVGYQPQCTYCADNPLVTPPGTQPTAQPNWNTYPVLGRIPVTDVTAASVILTEQVATYDGYAIPVSPLYGFRSTVNIRP